MRKQRQNAEKDEKNKNVEKTVKGNEFLHLFSVNIEHAYKT